MLTHWEKVVYLYIGGTKVVQVKDIIKMWAIAHNHEDAVECSNIEHFMKVYKSASSQRKFKKAIQAIDPEVQYTPSI